MKSHHKHMKQLFCLFNKKNRSVPPLLNVNAEISKLHFVIHLSGGTEEVEASFKHLLQMRPLFNIAFYQPDGEYARRYPNHAMYKIGIDLNSSKNLIGIFWFLRNALKQFDEQKFYSQIRFAIEDSLPIEETILGDRKQTLHELWRARHLARRIHTPLPEYQSPKENYSKK